MNYYQFHIGDYRSNTAHLSLLEHGIYRQLLDWYYMDERPIPKETKEVFRRLCARTDEERDCVINVLNDFFVLTDSGYTHCRCESEIETYKAKADRARSNGKLGGRPSKTKEVISGNPEETISKANHKPITNNHKPITKDKPPIPPKGGGMVATDFDEFWLAYPKKVGKDAAWRAWKKLREPKTTLRSILQALDWQRDSEQWTKDGGQYIPNPATYLNQGRWQDEQRKAEIPRLTTAGQRSQQAAKRWLKESGFDEGRLYEARG